MAAAAVLPVPSMIVTSSSSSNPGLGHLSRTSSPPQRPVSSPEGTRSLNPTHDFLSNSPVASSLGRVSSQPVLWTESYYSDLQVPPLQSHGSQAQAQKPPHLEQSQRQVPSQARQHSLSYGQYQDPHDSYHNVQNPFQDPTLMGDVRQIIMRSQSETSRTGAGTGGSWGVDDFGILPAYDDAHSKAALPGAATAAATGHTRTHRVSKTVGNMPYASMPLSSVSASASQSPTHLYQYAQFDPLFNSQQQVDSSGGAGTGAGTGGASSPLAANHGGTKSDMGTQGHRQSATLDMASLADIAAQLATLKPQKQDSGNLQQSNHVITLGADPSESTGTKKSHRRFKSQPFGRKGGVAANADSPNANGLLDAGTAAFDSNDRKDDKDVHHRRSFSAGLAAVFRRDDVGDGGDKDGRPRSVTPVGYRSPKEKKASAVSRSGSFDQHRGKDDEGGSSKDHQRPTTPLEKKNGGGVNLSASSKDDLSPTKLEIKLRSSEQDPSPHQVMIPFAQDILFPARLCQLLENYRDIDQNFDFGSLVGMPREQMSHFLGTVESSSPGRSVASPESLRPASPLRKAASPVRKTSSPRGKQLSPARRSSETQQLMEVHVPIIKFLVNADDLVLEGFFHEICDHTKRKSFDTTNEMSTRDRMEVAIFKSDAKRQFLVVYQGCSETQHKPIKKSENKDGIERRFTLGRKDDDNRFSEEQPVVVFPPFRKAYFNSEIEEKVFTALDDLSERHPFFDVIITGHSFGGVMALLSSMRYANIRPAIMVSCFAFGCPKVGNTDFRYYVNSLPNLRVFRFEYGCDPWTNVPDHPTWCHAGHTVTICKYQDFTAGHNSTDDNVELLIKAYKFGEHRPDTGGKESKLGKILSRQANKEKQMDHDISTYVHSLEQIIGYGTGPIGLWPSEFVGEDGTGVRGLDKENRLVC